MKVEVGKSYRLVADNPSCGGHGDIVTVRVDERLSGYGSVIYEGLDGRWAIKEDGTMAGYGRVVELDDEHQQAVVRAETRRPAVAEDRPPLFGDGLGDREHFRRVFATWDFSSFA